VRLTNAHASVPVGVDGQEELSPGSTQELPLPVTLRIGGRRVYIAPKEGSSYSLHSLAESPLPPGAGPVNSFLLSTVAAASPEKSLPLLLQVAMEVLHSAAISEDFFDL